MTTYDDYRQRILQVLVYIQNHLDESLTLEELAKVAHFSPYHFHRIFRGMTGESVKEYIRRLRLERAAHRLRHWDQPVTTVAFDAGYETHESFTRAFRSMFGKSPQDFRQSHRMAIMQSFNDSDVPQETPELRHSPVKGRTVKVTIKTIEPMRVAFVRHVGPYAGCHEAWEAVCRWAVESQAFGPNTRCIGIGHDDPDVTAPEKVRYDACLTIDDTVKPSGDVGVQEIPGGEYAVVTHQGPYEDLHKTYTALFREWIPSCGRELRSAPSFELYLNDLRTTPPEQLLTEIYLPLES